MTVIEGGSAAIRTQWGRTDVLEAPHYNETTNPWRSHYISDDGEVGLGMDAPQIPAGVLSSDQMQEEGDDTKIDVNGAVPVRFEPHGLFRYFAQLQRAAATAVVLTAAQSWRHKLAPTETDVDLDKVINAQLWQADGLPQMYTGGRVLAMQLNIAERTKVSGTFTLGFLQGTFYGLPVVVTEATTPQRPVVIGLPKYANHILADNDLYIKVQTAATNTIQVKVGAGSAYSNTQVVVDGELLDLEDESGDPIGELDSPTQLFVADTTDWSDDDEWRIPGDVALTAVPWTENLPAINGLNEIHATITIDVGDGNGAVERVLEQVQLTLTSPHATRFGIGGRWARGIDPEGQRIVAMQFTRRYTDTDIYKALLGGQTFAIDIVMSSRVNIGSSTDPYRIRLYAGKCRMAGRGPRVSGPNSIPEVVNATAYKNAGDATHPSDITVYLDNALSSLSAA